jgi:hypothetical protein
MILRDLLLLVIGCGTAGYHNTRVLGLTKRIAARTAQIIFVDRADIREHFNELTCTKYAGHDGRGKEARLAELARRWFGKEVMVKTSHCDAEDFDFTGLLAPPADKRITKIYALLGLDCWEARIAVVRALRFAGSAIAADVLVIQTAFDRGEAQVKVLGNGWNSPCVVCPLATLPKEQSCIIFQHALKDGGTELLRGDLRCEARSAAAMVRRVVLAELRGINRYRNTKMNLLLQADGKIQRVVRRLRRTKNCWGPHNPARRPLTIDEIFK